MRRAHKTSIQVFEKASDGQRWNGIYVFSLPLWTAIFWLHDHIANHSERSAQQVILKMESI